MSLLSTIKEVSQQKPNRFLAPIPSVETVSLFSLQRGIPYWFHLRSPKSGWHWVEPISKNKARIAEQAQPHEYLDYLSQLPKSLYIVLFSLGEDRSLVMSYDFLRIPVPRIMYLTRNHWVCRNPLSVVSGRHMGDVLLYNGVGYSEDALRLSREAQNALEGKIHGISVEIPKLFQTSFDIVYEKAEIDKAKQKKLTTEDKIKSDLDFVGATLVSWNENEDGYVIRYEYEGATFKVDLSQNRRVESAGICLAGTDLDHNLSTIVLAMQEARRLHRYDLDEDLWI